jgi:AbrB family looped-hinge helix DNA binding protein
MNALIRLDTRGRVVIPTEFREALAIKEGDEVLINLDIKTNTLLISPVYGETKDIVKIEIEFGDTPGCLAKIAQKIANMNVDLIISESRSSQRGQKARWDIIADISKSSFTINEIRQQLLQSGFVEEMRITKIARDRLHS